MERTAKHYHGDSQAKNELKNTCALCISYLIRLNSPVVIAPNSAELTLSLRRIILLSQIRIPTYFIFVADYNNLFICFTRRIYFKISFSIFLSFLIYLAFFGNCICSLYDISEPKIRQISKLEKCFQYFFDKTKEWIIISEADVVKC